MKILLVGGGITSAVTGTCLRKMFPESNITFWDKARGSGGRMTTSKCSINVDCIADIGAQYISTNEDVIKSNYDIYEDLLSENIFEPLNMSMFKGFKAQNNSKHFVVPNGTGFLVKHFMNKAKLNAVKFSHHVQTINREKDRWIVQTKSGEIEDFNIVILTMPVPQIFLLDGSVKEELNTDLLTNLNSVQYSSRYVLVMYFLENLKEDWGAQFVNNHHIFRYIAIDNIRRNRPNNLCAVVFHTSVDYGLKHVEDSIPDIETKLVSEAKLMFPDWPEPKLVKCHKWRYSQVLNPFKDSPGCVVVSDKPLLLIGGDGFTGSGFDNCVKSSKVMCEKVKQYFASVST